MTNQYIEREAAKRELLSWAVCINHPEYLIKDDALHIIDSFPAADVVEQEVLTMTEYIENPLSGKLRGVTYEDGKIIDVHIRDTDDVVKVFVPVRHGRWISDEGDVLFHCSECETQISTSWDYDDLQWNYCPDCGAKMDGGTD